MPARAARLRMVVQGVAVVALAAAVSLACASSSKAPTATAAPGTSPLGTSATAFPAATAPARARPPSVPETAQALLTAREFGAPDAAGAMTQLFFSQTCASGVVTVVTTGIVLYAELPCDRALPASVAQRFLGKPIRVRVAPGDPGKLYLESPPVGTVEFTVGGMWAQAAAP